MKHFGAALLLAIAASLSGCKSSGVASDGAAALKADEGAAPASFCCAFASNKGVFYETARCAGGDVRRCCEGVWRSVNSWGADYQYAYPFACDAPPPEALSQVSVCRGPTRFGEGAPGVGNLSDAVTVSSKLAHVWVKTPNVEVGMGPRQPDTSRSEVAFGRLMDFLTAKSIRDKVQVAWSDHSGFSDLPGAACSQLYLCDQACVEDEMQLGRPLGVYSLINQCHVTAVRALRKCGCFNHCVATIPGTSTCAKRVFPELRGLSLTGRDEEFQSEVDWDWREDYLVEIP